MKKIELYGIMGELAHEKKPVWAVTCPTDKKDVAEAKVFVLPDDAEVSENQDGQTIILIAGKPAELVTSKTGKAMLVTEDRVFALPPAVEF